ncbi:spore maturation protein [Desulfuribacillus stibiiarsenatis]|uniref:Spore maturation protein n=1 Tax=Desulfuribacillus stibiiarsenatis TaxID=1390249 RepID=A0A1E5L6H1_9FIRM|nr:spore maturation protein [Desulfuribacillus stibiiarsenatis]OEH85721.1 spore maturation protein [Desulfuribacillus stibiiarsenatis]
MYDSVAKISSWAIPIIVVGIPLYAYAIKKIPVYEIFIDGAKNGFTTAISILPHLVGMMVAITVFRESGALDFFLLLLEPVLKPIMIPKEAIPLGLIRPISGSAALGITTDIMNTFGPDSMIGRIASTVQGSTDTTLYVLTVYFGSVGVKKIRYALKVGLLADVAGFIAAVYICLLFFGS